MNNRLFRQLIIITCIEFVFMIGCKKSDNAKPNPDPVIAEVSPLSGLIRSSVTITGSHFSTDITQDTVRFNGVMATITSASSTSIAVTVPESATTGKISLTTNGKKLIYTKDFNVNFPVPVIDNVIITPVSYGGVIRITGYNFNPDASKDTVMLSDKVATVIWASATQLVARLNTQKITGQVKVTSYGKTLNYSTIYDFSSYTAVGYTTPVATGFLSADASGNIYGVSDNAVIKMSSSGAITTLTTIGSSGNVLKGTAVDAIGNVYVTGNSDRKIYKITPAGVISTFAGSGVSGYTDGQSGSAQFLAPIGLTIDASGNLFVCDSARIRKITPGGLVSTFAGNSNSGSMDGQALLATFNSLIAITADMDGNIFVINASGLIRKVTADGLVSTLNLQGPNVGDGGYGQPVWAHGIKAGTQIGTDRSGNLFVCNTQGIVFGTSNATGGVSYPVYLIDRTGFVDQFTSVSFVGYLGITSDNLGNIYISQRSYAYSGSFISKYSILNTGK